MQWDAVVEKVVFPMVLSPLVGGLLAFLLMIAILWIFRTSSPGRLNRGFRLAQTVSAAAMALGHGLQDAQKTMGVIVLALVVGGYQDAELRHPVVGRACSRPARSRSAPTPAAGGSCAPSAAGSSTSTRRGGFAAEIVGGLGALHDGVRLRGADLDHPDDHRPIMGVGATSGRRAVRWGVAGNILVAWVLTIPMAGLVAAGHLRVVHLSSSSRPELRCGVSRSGR